MDISDGASGLAVWAEGQREVWIETISPATFSAPIRCAARPPASGPRSPRAGSSRQHGPHRVRQAGQGVLHDGGQGQGQQQGEAQPHADRDRHLAYAWQQHEHRADAWRSDQSARPRPGRARPNVPWLRVSHGLHARDAGSHLVHEAAEQRRPSAGRKISSDTKMAARIFPAWRSRWLPRSGSAPAGRPMDTPTIRPDDQDRRAPAGW